MAGDFDAATDEIDIGIWNVGSIQTFTIGLWVYVDAFGGAHATDARFIAKANGTGATNHDWMIGQVNSSGQKWRVRFHAGGTVLTQVGTSTMNTGQWYFALLEYDGSEVFLYVDDVEEFSPAKTGDMNATNRDIFIGNNDGDDKAPNGAIAEVSVLSSLLSAGAKTGLSHGANIFGVVPISEAYYPLWLNDTTTTPDFSPNKRNGTITTVTKRNHPPVEMMENYL